MFTWLEIRFCDSWCLEIQYLGDASLKTLAYRHFSNKIIWRHQKIGWWPNDTAKSHLIKSSENLSFHLIKSYEILLSISQWFLKDTFTLKIPWSLSRFDEEMRCAGNFLVSLAQLSLHKVIALHKAYWLPCFCINLKHMFEKIQFIWNIHVFLGFLHRTSKHFVC